jgi:hypothetical protein
MRFLRYGNPNIWNALPERDAKFLPKLWSLAFGRHSKDKSINVWAEQASSSELHILSSTRFLTTKKEADILKYMPQVGDEWCLKNK